MLHAFNWFKIVELFQKDMNRAVLATALFTDTCNPRCLRVEGGQRLFTESGATLLSFTTAAADSAAVVAAVDLRAEKAVGMAGIAAVAGTVGIVWAERDTAHTSDSCQE